MSERLAESGSGAEASRGAQATRVVVLGAGPAGLGAALWLARRGFAVTVVEAQDGVGGNAGSFTLHGVRVDYGSHRLHPAADPVILAELRALLGEELVVRPRHGRILLGGRWVHFPLRAADLALHAPPRLVAGVALDALARAGRALVGTDPPMKVARSRPEGGPTARSVGGAAFAAGAPTPGASAPETFASVLLAALGPTVCREFYFPFARKVWGLEPQEISAAQARRRVSAGSLGALLTRVLPGRRRGGARAPRGTFWYPRGGFGRICEALRDAASAAGAQILLGARARRVAVEGRGRAVDVDTPAGPRTLEADHVWSTIPLGALARIADPPAPADVLDASAGLEHRAMLLVYLALAQDRFTEYDAHYFPSPDVPFTRLSEPKNYAGRSDPAGRTVLCAEIPCSTADKLWSSGDSALGALVSEGLSAAGLPVRGRVLDVAVRRLPSAYPLYRVGYEERFDRVDRWVSALPGVLSFGRQGLHAHDNTHHALAMARAAVACLADDGRFDAGLWARCRDDFTHHVVED